MDNVSYSVLSLEELRQARAPYKPRTGIYFLWSGEEIIYIGQSVNMESRVNVHMTGGSHVFRGVEITACTFVDCARDELDVLEALYIAKYKPKCNGGRKKRERTL